MSMDTCRKCGTQVDTDFDLEFYAESANTAHPAFDRLCERCRDQLSEPTDFKPEVQHERSG